MDIRSHIRNVSIALGDAIWENQNAISFTAGLVIGATTTFIATKKIVSDS